MWKYYALLSSLFDSLMAIISKIGFNVYSNFAATMRTTIFMLQKFGIVLLNDKIKHVSFWSWLFIILFRYNHRLFLDVLLLHCKIAKSSVFAPIEKRASIKDFDAIRKPVTLRRLQ